MTGQTDNQISRPRQETLENMKTNFPGWTKACLSMMAGSALLLGGLAAAPAASAAPASSPAMVIPASATTQSEAPNKGSARAASTSKSFTVRSAPKISGTTKAGRTLKVTKGRYSVTPSSHTYQWYRGSTKINGATKSSYIVTASDVGKTITAKVTIKRSSYASRTVASSAVSIPLPAAPPRVVISSDGTYRVGSGVKPGLYKATGSGATCYWETLNGFSGSFEDINSNHFGTSNTLVRLTSSDKGFSTSRCGSWKTVGGSGANASRITRDGTYRVGIDIKAGTYVGTSNGSGCYWATLEDFTGSFEDIKENYFGSARTIVEIPKDAQGFTVSGCGTLVRG